MKLAAALSLLAVPVDGRRSNPLLARHLQDELLAKELPDTGEEWSTLQNGVEFQPAGNLSPLAKEHLRRLTSSNTTADDEEDLDITDAYEKIFVDGAETRYDEYSQAWRALGFFVDCDYVDNGDDRRGRRSLQDGEGAGCQRFMLWAAYVDEEYSGNEVGEYMYYDRNNDKWDETACGYNQTNRCVKMDCHLPDTHFSLLGYFKEPNYDEWMNQLFKYEGDCVWTDEEYQFMQQSRDVWPTGCTESTHTILIHSYSSSLYYDIKPSEYGDYGIGLYTDNMCSMEYTGDITVDEVLRRMVCGYNGADGFADDLCSTGIDNWKKAWTAVNGNGYGDDDGARNLWSLVGQLEKWNNAFDVWKQCQPCKTHDLTDVVAGFQYEANADDTRYDFIDYNMTDDDAFVNGQCTCADDDQDDGNGQDGNNQEDEQCNGDQDYQTCEWTCFDQYGDQIENDGDNGRRHLEDQGGNDQNDDNQDAYNQNAQNDDNQNDQNDDNQDAYNQDDQNDDNQNDQNDDNQVAYYNQDGFNEYGFDQYGFDQYGYDQYGNKQKCCCCCKADMNVFQCNADAGYGNVNQCMKFKTKTRMMTASWNDMEMALGQGGIASIPLGNSTESAGVSSFTIRGKKYEFMDAKQADSVMSIVSFAMLLVTSVLFGGALYSYVGAKRESDNMNEPLIPSLKGVVA